MAVTRKPLAKIEGRKRMQASGLTVAWQGTRSLKDWAAYVENGTEQGRLVLADRVSERTVKSLLARIQNLSREELEAMGRTVQVVAQQGGGPPVPRPHGGGAGDGGTRDVTPGSEIVVRSPPGRQLALAGDGDGGSAASERSRRRVPATVESTPAESRRPARVSARDVAGTLRQLRSRVESLEAEQEQLRADLVLLRGEAEIFERVLAATRSCTTILISHRFSTVRHVDRIAVVEHGAVAELGSHEELMALRGRYWTMFSLQAQRFAEGTPEEGEEEVTFDVLT